MVKMSNNKPSFLFCVGMSLVSVVSGILNMFKAIMFVGRAFCFFIGCHNIYYLSNYSLFFFFKFLLLVFILLIFQPFGFSYVGYAFEWLNVVIFILCSLIQQVQKFFKESNDSSDARNVCFCYL